MEPKKNPTKDLNNKRGLYFVIGLCLVMLLTYVALEWKTYDNVHGYDISLNVADELIEEVPITMHIKTPPPPPPVPTPVIIEVVEDDKKVEETIIESTETDQEEVIEVLDVVVEKDEEPVEISFMVIEDVPIFPGCEKEKNKGAAAMRACFQEMMNKHISKNFRYPEGAQEMGIQGRVNVMFDIQKDGSIGNIRMRGPDKSLETEAGRIIGKLPKMTPGKQRGVPVRVPFSMPINFKLQ